MSNPICERDGGVCDCGDRPCAVEVRDVDELDARLMRPLFVLHMARPMERYARPGPQAQSARTRAMNARAEIHRIVRDYARDHPYDT